MRDDLMRLLATIDVRQTSGSRESLLFAWQELAELLDRHYAELWCNRIAHARLNAIDGREVATEIYLALDELRADVPAGCRPLSIAVRLRTVAFRQTGTGYQFRVDTCSYRVDARVESRR